MADQCIITPLVKKYFRLIIVWETQKNGCNLSIHGHFSFMKWLGTPVYYRINEAILVAVLDTICTVYSGIHNTQHELGTALADVPTYF